jgi:hypothetical protein
MLLFLTLFPAQSFAELKRKILANRVWAGPIEKTGGWGLKAACWELN